MLLVDDLRKAEGARVTVLGEFTRFDGSHAVLKTDSGEVRVVYKGMDMYQTKHVLVTGAVQDNQLIEEHVFRVDGNADPALFRRLAPLTQKYQDIF